MGIAHETFGVWVFDDDAIEHHRDDFGDDCRVGSALWYGEAVETSQCGLWHGQLRRLGDGIQEGRDARDGTTLEERRGVEESLCGGRETVESGAGE